MKCVYFAPSLFPEVEEPQKESAVDGWEVVEDSAGIFDWTYYRKYPIEGYGAVEIKHPEGTEVYSVSCRNGKFETSIEYFINCTAKTSDIFTFAIRVDGFRNTRGGEISLGDGHYDATFKKGTAAENKAAAFAYAECIVEYLRHFEKTSEGYILNQEYLRDYIYGDNVKSMEESADNEKDTEKAEAIFKQASKTIEIKVDYSSFKNRKRIEAGKLYYYAYSTLKDDMTIEKLNEYAEVAICKVEYIWRGCAYYSRWIYSKGVITRDEKFYKVNKKNKGVAGAKGLGAHRIGMGSSGDEKNGDYKEFEVIEKTAVRAVNECTLLKVDENGEIVIAASENSQSAKNLNVEELNEATNDDVKKDLVGKVKGNSQETDSPKNEGVKKFEVGKYYAGESPACNAYIVYKCIGRNKSKVTLQESFLVNEDGEKSEMRGDIGKFKVSVHRGEYEEVRLEKRRYVWACSLYDAASDKTAEKVQYWSYEFARIVEPNYENISFLGAEYVEKLRAKYEAMEKEITGYKEELGDGGKYRLESVVYSYGYDNEMKETVSRCRVIVEYTDNENRGWTATASQIWLNSYTVKTDVKTGEVVDEWGSVKKSMLNILFNALPDVKETKTENGLQKSRR